MSDQDFETLMAQRYELLRKIEAIDAAIEEAGRTEELMDAVLREGMGY